MLLVQGGQKQPEHDKPGTIDHLHAHNDILKLGSVFDDIVNCEIHSVANKKQEHKVPVSSLLADEYLAKLPQFRSE